MRRLNPATGAFVLFLMKGIVGLLVLATVPLSLSVVQTGSPATPANLPKPAVHPTVGTWKYQETEDFSRLNNHSTFSIAIQDDGSVWTVVSSWEFPEGAVTDVSTLEKGTLILRKESFRHFLHADQPWKPIAINLDYTAHKVTGAMKYVNAPDKPVAVDLSGPVFAYGPGPELTIGFLPLTEGYSAVLRVFDIERLAVKPEAPDNEKLLAIKVVGMERVTVPAGTFDSYKVELTTAGAGSNQETVWIAKDSRMPVKIYAVEVLKNGATDAMTVEMVP